MKHNRRDAFTLVEILVAMALTLFVMVILSQAFIAGLDVFSGLKSIGDMQEQLRTAKQLMVDDLGLDHIEGKRRLSDPTMSSANVDFQRVREGYFRIVQASPSAPEGPPLPPPLIPTDSYGLPSYRAGATGDQHWLQFTVKQRGNRRDKFFSALVPVNSPLATLGSTLLQNPGIENDANMRESPLVYKSPWAEVAWFLVPQGSTIEQNNPSGPGAPLYGLYRSQFVIPVDTRGFAVSPRPPGVPEQPNIACVDGVDPNGNPVTYYRSPTDMADDPALRVFYINNKARGATLVLSNVLNFHIQVLKKPADPRFQDIGEDKNGNGILDPGEDFNGNGLLDTPEDKNFNGILDPGEDTNGNGILDQTAAGAYDTWWPTPQSGMTPPAGMYPIYAIRITIRVWDSKVQQTRQVTLIQDL